MPCLTRFFKIIYYSKLAIPGAWKLGQAPSTGSFGLLDWIWAPEGLCILPERIVTASLRFKTSPANEPKALLPSVCLGF